MNKEQRKKALFAVIILILLATILYSGLQILESALSSKGGGQLQTVSKVIERDGVKYYPRKDITTILVLGINQSGKVTPTPYNHGGAVDMLTLMIFDEETEKCTLINLNRDMMVTMPTLNDRGWETGTYYGQLAYSHTYGDGMKASCKNVCKTVSSLFYGLPIDHYISLNMDTIAILNDAVGGVKVTVTDDFSAVDPDLPMGEVLLRGKQAVTFVQTRWDVGDQTNTARLERQKMYMNAFVQNLRTKMQNEAEFVFSTYEQIVDYIVTDCSAETLSRLEKDYGDYTAGEVISLEGENVLGEELYEFYVDEDALDALILNLLYSTD